MSIRVGGFVVVLWTLLGIRAEAAEYLLVGVDSKVDITTEGVQKLKPGTDLVVMFDIATSPERPKLIAELPVSNSMFGPPTNLAVAKAAKMAIVANSVNWMKTDGAWDGKPDTHLQLIDIAGTTPKLLGKVDATEQTLQPSGMAVSGDGKWVAVAGRKSGTVSLLAVEGQSLKYVDSVAIDGEAAAVAFTSDGRRVLVTKFSQHAVAVVDIADGKLSYDAANDLAVGRWPYNVQVVPNGSIALVANNGMNGLPDGHTDTVSVVDLGTNPPSVIDHVTVGDGPEGMAISPDGKMALVPLLQGSAPWFEDDWFFHERGSVAVLSIDGKQVKKTGEVPVGRFPEGVGFNRAGTYAYVGDLLDNQVSVLKIDGSTVTNTGQPISVPGHPASLRTELP